MNKLLNSQQMNICDKNMGESSIQLVWRAGKKLADFIIENYKDMHITFFCGGHNNGADGLAAAKMLLDMGNRVQVFLICNSQNEANEYYAKKLDNIITDIDKLIKTPVAVDCIFGTGFHGEIIGKYKDVIAFASSFSHRIACDIASGLNADNGLASENTFLPHQTLTFQTAKVGHFLNSGKDYTGELTVCDIGINTDIVGGFMQFDYGDFVKVFPKRKQNIHKGSGKKVALIAGSEQFFGASLLSENAISSLRMGVGYTTLVTHSSLKPYVLSRITQSTALFFEDFRTDFFEKICIDYDVIVCGMGLENTPLTRQITQFLLENFEKRLVLDADSLNAIDSQFLDNKKCELVITPHPKEFSRIANLSMDKILSNPIEVSENFAKKHKLTLLLKGASTIITNGTNTILTTNGTNALAKAGSGDLLAGILGGMLTKDFDVLTLTASASFCLAEASQGLNSYASIATDIIQNLYTVISRVQKENLQA